MTTSKGMDDKTKSPKRRAPRGTGSIFPAVRRGKKVWIGRRVVGHTATGKPVYREVWAETQAAAVKKLAAVGPATEETTVSAWAARWLPTLTIRPATKAGYVAELDNHILPAIGHLRVAAVKPSHIEALTSALGRDKGPKSAGLKVGTVLKVLATARQLFGAAVREGLIATNPVSVAKRPRPEKRTIHPFTPAELVAIVDDAADLSAGPLIALLAATGCRLGEASALDVSDWDEKAGTVAITKTYSKAFGMGPPKSKHSRRTIVVPAVARPALIRAAGTRINAPLFVTENGNRFIKSLVQRAFKRLLARMELEDRNVHQLRHSVATVLVSSGTPLGDVAKYLGDSVATVVRTYLHPTGHSPAADLDRIFAGRAAAGNSPQASAV